MFEGREFPAILRADSHQAHGLLAGVLAAQPPPNTEGPRQRLPCEARHQFKRSMNQGFFPMKVDHFKSRFLKRPLDDYNTMLGQFFFLTFVQDFNFCLCRQTWFLYQCTEHFIFSCFVQHCINYVLCSISSPPWKFATLISSFLETSYFYCFGAPSSISTNIF